VGTIPVSHDGVSFVSWDQRFFDLITMRSISVPLKVRRSASALATASTGGGAIGEQRAGLGLGEFDMGVDRCR
jgi:hypothetical protein